MPNVGRVSNIHIGWCSGERYRGIGTNRPTSGDWARVLFQWTTAITPITAMAIEERGQKTSAALLAEVTGRPVRDVELLTIRRFPMLCLGTARPAVVVEERIQVLPTTPIADAHRADISGPERGGPASSSHALATHRRRVRFEQSTTGSLSGSSRTSAMVRIVVARLGGSGVYRYFLVFVLSTRSMAPVPVSTTSSGAARTVSLDRSSPREPNPSATRFSVSS